MFEYPVLFKEYICCGTISIFCWFTCGLLLSIADDEKYPPPAAPARHSKSKQIWTCFVSVCLSSLVETSHYQQRSIKGIRYPWHEGTYCVRPALPNLPHLSMFQFDNCNLNSVFWCLLHRITQTIRVARNVEIETTIQPQPIFLIRQVQACKVALFEKQFGQGAAQKWQDDARWTPESLHG